MESNLCLVLRNSVKLGELDVYIELKLEQDKAFFVTCFKYLFTLVESMSIPTTTILFVLLRVFNTFR